VAPAGAARTTVSARMANAAAAALGQDRQNKPSATMSPSSRCNTEPEARNTCGNINGVVDDGRTVSNGCPISAPRGYRPQSASQAASRISGHGWAGAGPSRRRARARWAGAAGRPADIEESGAGDVSAPPADVEESDPREPSGRCRGDRGGARRPRLSRCRGRR
jgi:hypothetical protein